MEVLERLSAQKSLAEMLEQRLVQMSLIEMLVTTLAIETMTERT